MKKRSATHVTTVPLAWFCVTTNGLHAPYLLKRSIPYKYGDGHVARGASAVRARIVTDSWASGLITWLDAAIRILVRRVTPH